MFAPPRLLAAAPLLAVAATGCFRLFAGGAKADFEPPRRASPADVAVPPGFRVDVVATGLRLPVGVAFDAQGRPHVVEAGYSYGEIFEEGRLRRIEADGSLVQVAHGDHVPWTGAVFHEGAFFLAQGGEAGGGRIVRVEPDGRIVPLVEDLPGLGDHHTNGPALGPDGWLYFGQGTATNSGVVGPDNADFGWLRRHPDFHDVACRDLVLSGELFRSPDPLRPGEQEVLTGAYAPFGATAQPGQVVPGRLPCNGAVMRLRPDGSGLELVAWGLRNPFGLAFSPDGRLFVSENGYDVRGSRPVWGAGDYLWEVRPGAWYGWPDYAGGEPLWGTERFQPPGGPVPPRLLREHPQTPPKPAVRFGVHSSSNAFDFSRSEAFGHRGEAFVAQFGDMAPNVGKVLAPVGFRVVRADPATGVVETFATNRKGNGPASVLDSAGLERPVAARFDASGEALYVVDFGVLETTEDGRSRPVPGTGVLWRISRLGRTP